jgi:hypothetical protein
MPLTGSPRGAGHEGALAHLAGMEHVVERTAGENFVEVAVGLPLHVGGRVRAPRASSLVEAHRDRIHRRQLFVSLGPYAKCCLCRVPPRSGAAIITRRRQAWPCR